MGRSQALMKLTRKQFESFCRNEEELREQVRITLLHEIGHYFGLDEDRLAELGYE